MHSNNNNGYQYQSGTYFSSHSGEIGTYKTITYNGIPAVQVEKETDYAYEDGSEFERIDVAGGGVRLHNKVDKYGDSTYFKNSGAGDEEIGKKEFNNGVGLVESSMHNGHIKGRIQMENMLDRRAITQEVDRMAGNFSIPTEITNVIRGYVKSDNVRNIEAEKKTMVELLAKNRRDTDAQWSCLTF